METASDQMNNEDNQTNEDDPGPANEKAPGTQENFDDIRVHAPDKGSGEGSAETYTKGGNIGTKTEPNGPMIKHEGEHPPPPDKTKDKSDD